MTTGAAAVPRFPDRWRNGGSAKEDAPAAVEAFLSWAHSRGLRPTALELTPTEARLRLPPGAVPFRVSWRRPWELRLGGVTLLSVSLPRSGLFGRYPLERVIMPVDVERLAADLGSLPMVEKIGVFVEEVDPILAVRVAGRWLEVHRWLRRPYILSDDEVLVHRAGEKQVVVAA